MYSKATKTISLLLSVLILILSFPGSFEGKTIQSLSASLYENSYLDILDFGAVAISFDNKRVSVYELASGITHSFESYYRIGDYNICGSSIYFICNDPIYDQNEILCVCKFDLSDDSIAYYAFNDMHYLLYKAIAVDGNGRFYMTDKRDTKTIRVFNENSVNIKNYEFDYSVSQLLTFTGRIYAVTSGGVFLFNETRESFSRISNCKIYINCRFSNESLISDCGGNIYKFGGKSVTQLSTLYCENAYPYQAADNKYFYSPDANRLVVVSRDDNIQCGEINFGQRIKNVISYNNTVYALASDNEIFEVSKENVNLYEDYVEYKERKENDNSKNTSSGSKNNSPKGKDNSASANNNTKGSDKNTEALYTINGNVITGISPKTTVSRFRESLGVSKNNVQIFKHDNTPKNSGYIGTAMTVIVNSDNSKAEYKTLVKGELTGEGNINSKDVDAAFDILLGKEASDELFLSAADINDDNVINTTDLLLLSKMCETLN